MLCKLCEIKSHGSWWDINRQYKTSSLMHALRAFYHQWGPLRRVQGSTVSLSLSIVGDTPPFIFRTARNVSVL